MIAEWIYQGKTAEGLGISQVEWESRKALVERFLLKWGGGDFQTDYLAWVQAQMEGDRGPGGEVESIASVTEADLPSLPQMARNFAKSATRHITSGAKNVSDEESERRRKICDACELLLHGKDIWGDRDEDKDRCTHPKCGCFMKVKARWETSECPERKW